MSARLWTGSAVLLALAIAGGAAFWQFDRAGVAQRAAPAQPGNVVTTRQVSAAQLARTSQALDQPIYWIGVSGRTPTYELVQNSDGDVTVRYLPAGVLVGSRRPYLAVGTYPMKNAFAVTNAIANKAGSVRISVPKPAVAFSFARHPESIYLAFPHSSHQIEVFDPSESVAREIVRSGAIVDAGGAAQESVQAVTPQELSRYSAALDQPIFWLGPKKNTTYEFTRTSDGRIYVRYLPEGAAVGTRQPYVTVGTYPMANAYAVTSRLTSGSTKIAAAPTFVALTVKRRPTSVFLAFLHTNYQVEVFDPVASVARQIIAAGQVTRAG